MTKIKACPLCEKINVVKIDSKRFYDELMEANGDIAFSVECKDCHLELTDFVSAQTDYNEAYERLANRWNALPRWQKLCIKI